MHYPQEFIDRCRRVYPTWVELHQGLERGDTFAGRYLDDASHPASISVSEVLSATSLEELKTKARNINERAELYAEWSRLYDEQAKEG